MNFEETNGIQTGAGIKLVIYGQEGVGKTSLAAQLPGAVFLDCEGSTSKMNVRRLPKPSSWEMLQQELDFVLESHAQRQHTAPIRPEYPNKNNGFVARRNLFTAIMPGTVKLFHRKAIVSLRKQDVAAFLLDSVLPA
jgi:GTPase SAR1 family protein